MSVKRPSAGAVARVVTTGLLFLLPGCTGRVGSIVGTNQPPEIEIVDARADRTTGGVRVRWAARDPDGRVRQSRWTLAAWSAPARGLPVSATTASECVLPREEAALAGGARPPREPERFTLWAVDDAGAE